MNAPSRITSGPVLKAVAAVLALAGTALAAHTAALHNLSEESLQKGLEGALTQLRNRTGSQVSDERVSQLARTATATAARERSQDRRWMLRVAVAALFAGAAAGAFLGRAAPTRSVAALGALLGALIAYSDLKDFSASLDFSNAIGGGLYPLSLLTLGLVPLAALLCAALSFKATWTMGTRA